MSVIIRLQNLPWSANSLDIRQYFRGLSIPEGGVHIVGGEMGDAFIAFSTDEDARQAMMLQGGKIKEVQISLMLSSRSEMQKVIELARQASMSNPLAQLLVPPQQPILTAPAAPLQPTDRRDSNEERKDMMDRSRSRSKERGRKDNRRGERDRRDRDRDRDRERDRRRRSRSRSRDRRRRRSRSRSRDRENMSKDRDRDRKEEPKKDIKMDPQPVTQTVVTQPVTPVLTNWMTMQPGVNPYLTNQMAYGMMGALPTQPLMQPTLMPLIQDVKEQSNSQSPDTNSRDPRSRGTDSTRPISGAPSREPVGNTSQRDTMMNMPARATNPFDMANNSYSTPAFPPMRTDVQPNGSVSRDVDTRPDYRQPMNQSRPFINEPSGGRFGGSRDMNHSYNDRNSNYRNRSQNDRYSSRRNYRDDGDNYNDNYRESHEDDEEGVDEFGRSLKLRTRKDDDEEDDDYEPRGQPNFPTRFMPSNNGPRGRDNWNSRNNENGDRRFSDRERSFRPREDRFSRRDDDRYSRDRSKQQDDGFRLQDCCVQISRVPINAVYGDVRRGFHIFGVHIESIKFAGDESGKRALIRFAKPEDKKKVIQSMRKVSVCDQEVKISHLTDEDFEKAQDEFVRRRDEAKSEQSKDVISPEEDCLQVCNLPSPFNDTELRAMFPNFELENLFLAQCGNVINGFVRFKKAEDAVVALKSRNRVCRNVPVLLTPVSRQVFMDKLAEKTEKEKKELEMRKRDENNKKEIPMLFPQTVSDVILMKQLPNNANDRDICDFFSDVGLVPLRIHLMLDLTGNPSGDAFCEFADAEKATTALAKNGSPMGKNMIQLSMVPRGDMNNALGILGDQPMQDLPPPQETRPLVRLENVPYAATDGEIIRFFGPSYNLGFEDVERKYNERGMTTGDSMVKFHSLADARRAVSTLNFRNIRDRRVRLILV